MSLTELPIEVIFNELEYLSYPDIVKLCNSSTQFREICQNKLVKNYIQGRKNEQRYRHFKIIDDMLIKKGYKLSDIKRRLIYAAGEGFNDVVEMELSYGEFSDEDLFHALLAAADSGKLSTVNYLLPLVEDPNQFEGWLLEQTIKYGHMKVLERLLKDKRFPYDDINSLLFYAIEADNLELAQIIVSSPQGDPCFTDHIIGNIKRKIGNNEVISYLKSTCIT